MSMKNYPVSETGLIVKVEEIDWAAILKATKTDYDSSIDLQTLDGDDLIEIFGDEDTIWLGEGWEDGVIMFKRALGGSEADGDFYNKVKETVDVGIRDVDAREDDWVIFCLPRYASLFEQAYENETSLLEQMKTLYSRFIKDEHFNYANRLAEYNGTIYG